MITVDDIKKHAVLFIRNINLFDNVTVEAIKDKDKELDTLATGDFVARLKSVRPYPGVILSMEVEDLKFLDNYKNKGATASISAEFHSKVYTRDENISFTDTIVKYNLTFSTINDIIKVTGMTQEREVLYTDYFNRPDIESSVPEARRAGAYLRDNYNKLTHIKYMFKGKPTINPFDTKEKVSIDSFNLLYWLYKQYGVDIEYPVSVQYMLDSERFTHILLKGHKSLSDIENLIEGDLIFFDKNDTTVGVYTGDGEFVTIEGEFPMDNSSLQKIPLKTWWERFNGRVLRFEEDIDGN